MSRTIYFVLVTASIVLLPLATFAPDGVADVREPDSEYVESERESSVGEGGGLLDFLPFFGGQSKGLPSEKLVPSPPPQESKPVLSKDKLEALQMSADRWMLTSEFTQPTLRQDAENRYYRDYIVFSGEYTAEVLRGETEENPFVGHIYIKGDYFTTDTHGDAGEAEADFHFKYQQREFRLIFDRIEKWDYSDNPNDDPFTFTERWEFRKLQSRPVVDFSKDEEVSDRRPAPRDVHELQESTGE